LKLIKYQYCNIQVWVKLIILIFFF